jgi:NADPH-dependent curcumin reductase CurA
MTALPANRRILLVSRPVGIPQPGDFAIDEAVQEPIHDGQFRIRNLFLSVDPAQRGWANEGSNYAPAVPLGSVMRALAVGRVVETAHADFPVGSHVYGWLGWQHYAVATPADILSQFTAPAAPLSCYAGILGINGLTAHLALNGIGRPRAGDTVLVSTAAGAVGSVVGQLARAQGCEVVGLTGDDDKARLCQARFGYHRADNYKTGTIDTVLDAAVPDGVDVFFDSVGGEILDATLRRMRTGGRIVQCGTASIATWNPAPVGLRNEREVLTRRLSWGGFVIFDHVAEFSGAIAELAAALRSGALAYDEDIRAGLDRAPEALVDLYAGRNRGKVLISLD